MILRQSANAALHLAGGVALGVTLVLAACTLAQLAKSAQRGTGGGAAPEPPITPAPETLAGASGDTVDTA